MRCVPLRCCQHPGLRLLAEKSGNISTAPATSRRCNRSRGIQADSVTMTGIVETYRYALLGAGTVEPRYLIVSAVATVFLIISGVLLFSRTERTFIDTV